MNKNSHYVKENNSNTEKFEDQIEGRNAVLELLESEKDINKIYKTKENSNYRSGERKNSTNGTN